MARLAALLVLIAGLAGASAPGSAAMPAQEQPQAMHAVPSHAGMDCDGATHKPAPRPHAPAGDCCMVNVCAMTLALPAAQSGLALPLAAEMPRYHLHAPQQPLGIVAAPIPHPPKFRA